MKILLATDGSESAQAATSLMMRFPFPENSEVIVLNVIDTHVAQEHEVNNLSPAQTEALQETEQVILEEGRRLLDREATRLRNAGWAGTTELRTGHPAEEIVKVAEEFSVDLTILGSHGLSSVKRFLLGSVSDHVLHYAHCSVLVVKASHRDDLASISPSSTAGGAEEKESLLKMLLTFDNSVSSRQAVEFCASLPLDQRVEVTVLTILPLVTLYRQDVRQRLGWFWQEKKKALKKSLEWVVKEIRWTTPNIKTQLLESTDVSHAILDAATEFDSELIVLGHKGKGAIEKFLLGSVTTRIAHHAPCSVLAVRSHS